MKIIDRVLNKIASYYINNKVFSKDIAKRMPIYCSWHVKWGRDIKKGSILLDCDKIYKGMIQIGFDRIAAGLLGNRDSSVIIEGDGKIVFGGKADLSQGISVYVEDHSLVEIGSDIYTNGYCSIRCCKKITIGRDNMWGWGVSVRDSDGHPIYDFDHNIINHNREVVIGDDVWIGAESKVLKGANIPDGCIVGMGSNVTRKFLTNNAIIVGNPAGIVKEGILWNRGDFPKL